MSREEKHTHQMMEERWQYQKKRVPERKERANDRRRREIILNSVQTTNKRNKSKKWCRKCREVRAKPLHCSKRSHSPKQTR